MRTTGKTGGARSVTQVSISMLVAASLCSFVSVADAGLMAGVGRVDITRADAGPVNGRLYARALVLKSDSTLMAIVSLDVVAIGEIGHVNNEFAPTVRRRVEQELGIPFDHVVLNASHCHGIPARDIDERTFQAIQQAALNLVPVQVGVGKGHENRISANRRLQLKNGREIDVRHAYAMPADDQVKSVGPIDPEIALLRLNRMDGRCLAVVYNFACHPIQGVPGGQNTADITGFSSSVIEDNLDSETVALFLQGCGGDINPVLYKDVHLPRNAEPLGNTLGLSTLKAVRSISCQPDNRLTVLNETIELPRADYEARIAQMEEEQTTLLESLRGTTLNLKTFLQLTTKHGLSPDFPSYYSHRYLHEKQLGQDQLASLDETNRRAMRQYVENVRTMEQLTRVRTNLRLLKKHQKEMVAAGRRTLDTELVAARIGDLVLLTFPGELTVQIGLNLKSASPHEHTCIAGYTNGYIYYAPTAEQLLNAGGAQEDSDCLLAPEWQAVFEEKAKELLNRL